MHRVALSFLLDVPCALGFLDFLGLVLLFLCFSFGFLSFLGFRTSLPHPLPTGSLSGNWPLTKGNYVVCFPKRVGEELDHYITSFLLCLPSFLHLLHLISLLEPSYPRERRRSTSKTTHLLTIWRQSVNVNWLRGSHCVGKDVLDL